jgi:hypothetical protein
MVLEFIGIFIGKALRFIEFGFWKARTEVINYPNIGFNVFFLFFLFLVLSNTVAIFLLNLRR